MTSAREHERELAAVLAGLHAELAADLARVAVLRPLARRRARTELYGADLASQLGRAHAAAVITLVGATGAGKSTLLNALVGRPVAIEGIDRPTTSRPVVYAPLDADVSALIDGLPGHAAAVVRYDPGHAGPWSEQVLVDAPDTNSVAAEHRAVVGALAEKSDVLVVCLHRQSLVEARSVSFLDDFAGRRGLVFVLGRADELAPSSRAALLGDLRRLVAERFRAADAPVIALSARDAQTQPDTPGWSDLRAALAALVGGGLLGGVRRHNALGTAARLGALVGEARREAAPDLERLVESTRRGAAALGVRLREELAARLAARRADVVDELVSTAGRLWNGPGGYALRARSLAGLGLGAGAVLARRNPLLAAGAAAGGLAAERAREELRQARLSRADGLALAPAEVERAFLCELGEARIVGARLTGAPEALGLGPPAAAVEAQAGIAEEVSLRLFARELPRTAERAAPVWLRLPLDLPVYALAGFVVWRAALGFAGGAYVGVDFLLNALVLALAWLFLVRLFVVRLLAWRASACLARAEAELAAALGDWADGLGAAVEAAVEEQRGALERLEGSAARWRDVLQGERASPWPQAPYSPSAPVVVER